jgi:hypothetical protein
MLSNALPYYFLRPLLPSHTPGTAPRSLIRNRAVITDPYTTIATSLLSTAIFAVLLEGAFATYLPTWLVTHFNGLRTIAPAHLGAQILPTLLLALIPAGYAVQAFLFAPAEAAAFPPPPSTTITIDPALKGTVFDPATSTFAAHVHYNLWGWYSPRQKELIRRTGILTGLVFSETLIGCWKAIKGVEIEGAALYAGVWATGCVICGVALDWVGGPSD